MIIYIFLFFLLFKDFSVVFGHFLFRCLGLTRLLLTNSAKTRWHHILVPILLPTFVYDEYVYWCLLFHSKYVYIFHTISRCHIIAMYDYVSPLNVICGFLLTLHKYGLGSLKKTPLMEGTPPLLHPTLVYVPRAGNWPQ